jgi:hypothetical protein
MGQRWDTGETAFDPAFWAEVLRVLKPGAHLVAFGGTRTYHRMVCAIEDAGFEIRDGIFDLVASDAGMGNFLASLNDEQRGAFAKLLEESRFGGLAAWAYGVGFPKSHDVSKGIDGKLSTGRSDSLAMRDVNETRPGPATVRRASLNGHAGFVGAEDAGPSVKRGTPSFAAAAEWSGWGTALKPAIEPIVLARKPLGEKTVAANVLTFGTGAVNIDACRIGTDDELRAGAGRLLSHVRDDKPYPNGRAGEASADRRYSERGSTNFAATPGPRGGSDEGRWPANLVTDGSDEVLAAFPETPGQLRPVTGDERAHRTSNAYGDFGRTDGGFDPRGDGGSAARFFFSAKADAEDRFGSKHPTVKPIDLLRWLVRLVTPPGGTVLDPFAGSGTTGIAALAEGFNAILIEREEEYLADIRERIAFYSGEGRHSMASKNRQKKPRDSAPLFDTMGTP